MIKMADTGTDVTTNPKNIIISLQKRSDWGLENARAPVANLKTNSIAS